ncbi:phage tail fiber protein [Citrobacter portucalensis]|uniref:phage tail fiber protein n=1 Tax=Citrobacter portucalensis TaxID=1639133 RepID=UPI00397C5A3C
MSAGTLTLTNNSAAVAGSGTAFTTEVAAGDFIVVSVGGIPYTLPIKSVESGAALTLVSNFTGPTQSGAAWSAVPRVALNMVTAALVTQSAEALRGLNYDKQNWQQVFSGSGNITVRLPDGSSYTGPAWGGISTVLGDITTSMGGKADIAALDNYAKKGANTDISSLTGLTTPLGSAYGGTGGKRGCAIGINQDDYGNNTGGWTGFVNYITGAKSSACGSLFVTSDGPWVTFMSVRHRNGAADGDNFGFTIEDQEMFTASYNSFFIRKQASGTWAHPAKLYNDKNTTVDANGFIKAASPVIQIYADGRSKTNEESEGVMVTRQAVGEYLITGCLGLNADASWGGCDGGFEIPVDRNKQPRLWLDYVVNSDGSVLVKTYHRTHPNAPEFARNERKNVFDGEPVDIPADQFVSVRVEMPQNSIWNQKQKDMREAMEKEERERQQNQQDAQV